MVEILIGFAISLIGIMMMFQLTENWELRKRTTASGSDAQTSGSIASFRLSQDIRQAGYGFGTAEALIGCNVNAYDTARVPTAFSFPMVPVVIEDGAGGAPDSITVLFGSSPTMTASIKYKATTSFSKTGKDSREGISIADLVVVAPSTGNDCELIEITNNTGPDNIINHGTGTYTDDDLLITNRIVRFNDPAGYDSPTPDGRLFLLGDSPRRNVWQITNRTLQVSNDLMGAAAEDVAEGIVDLQAQYGLDTDNDNVVDTWTATDPATWSTVRAIRVSLLARSQHFEKEAVTINAPSTGWKGAMDVPILFSVRDADGNAPANDNSPNDWRHYRYRVYATTIPLRNMVWGTTPGAPL